MSTDMSLFHAAGVPVNTEDFAAALQHAVEKAPDVGGSAQYMRMNQAESDYAGLLTYGSEFNEVSPDDLWVVATESMREGYLLRKGGKVVDEAWFPVGKAPDEEEMPAPERDHKWHQAYKGALLCIEGNAFGVGVEYGGSAGGHTKLFSKVIYPAIYRRIREGDYTDGDNPVISLSVIQYDSNNQKKTIYEAEGTIVDWVSVKEVADIMDSGSPMKKKRPHSLPKTRKSSSKRAPAAKPRKRARA